MKTAYRQAWASVLPVLIWPLALQLPVPILAANSLPYTWHVQPFSCSCHPPESEGACHFCDAATHNPPAGRRHSKVSPPEGRLPALKAGGWGQLQMLSNLVAFICKVLLLVLNISSVRCCYSL